MMTEPIYHAPRTLAEVQTLCAENKAAALIAGGQWLAPLIRAGARRPNHIVSLSKVEALRGISSTDGTVRIGAGEPHAALSRSAVLAKGLPILSDIAGQIGDAATRHRGTIGGAICADPGRTDYAAALLGLDAQLITTDRRLSAAEFYANPQAAKFSPGEILVALEFGVRTFAKFGKIPNRAANHADVGVIVASITAGDFRVVAYGDAVWPQRLSSLESQFKTERQIDVSVVRDNPRNPDAFFNSRLTAILEEILDTL